MTKIVFSICVILSCLCCTAQENVIKNIGTALQSGSARELIKYCNNNVEIKINGANNSYSIPQAEAVLKDFFEKNVPQSFVYIHQGSSSEGLKYSIGKYTFKEGSYRVVMFLKEKSDRYLIDTITFSKE
jgi:hypothetical protein